MRAWIDWLVFFFGLWVLILVGVAALSGGGVPEAEPALPAITAAPPPCTTLYTFSTVRKDKATGWMLLCSRGTQPSSRSHRSPHQPSLFTPTRGAPKLPLGPASPGGRPTPPHQHQHQRQGEQEA